MVTKQPLKVSYCTTCRGRLHHLQETLPKNLAAEKDNPNVEFVIVSYGKDPEMDAYMHQYDAEIASGRIKYVIYPAAESFKMAHAKNMAHRMASGDILCNLDADNILAPDYARWLQHAFEDRPDLVVSHHPVTLKDELDMKIMDRLRGVQRPSDGYGGRIVVSADHYKKLGGYNEAFSGWGPDDANFVMRAKHAGMQIVKHPREQWGDIIYHGHDERIENLSEADKERSTKLLERSKPVNFMAGIKRLMVKPQMEVNQNGQTGCGEVYVNFSDHSTTVLPLGITEKITKARDASGQYNAGLLKTNWRADIAAQKELTKEASFERS